VGLLAAILALAGCASSDLTKNDNTASEVAISLPPGTSAPTLIVRAIWSPGASGFGSVDSMLVHESGVLALADDKLWFLSWDGDEKHYDMDHMIDVETINDAHVSRLGASLMLVVQSHNLSYDGFTLMGTGQIQSDPGSTQGLLDRLKAIRAAHPDKDFGTH
jgi:hypothetical protein